MRPIWKGHITFGLVNVPVILYPAEQRADLQLHLIDSSNYSRVRYERVNVETGEEVPWDRIVRGYEFDDGNYVLLSQEEFKMAAPEATKAVEVEAFVNLDEIDLVYFDKPYFLAPGAHGEKGYALLRDVLADTGKAGIARVVIRTRQYIAAMVPRDKVILLNLLRFQQELRSPEDLDLPGESKTVGVTKQELDMAKTLVNSMTAKWKPAAYHDEYRESLMKWIEDKIESGEYKEVYEPGPEEDEEAPAPINLMEALKKSLKPSAKSTGRSTTKTGTRSSSRSASASKSRTKTASEPTRRRQSRKKAG